MAAWNRYCERGPFGVRREGFNYQMHLRGGLERAAVGQVLVVNHADLHPLLGAVEGFRGSLVALVSIS